MIYTNGKKWKKFGFGRTSEVKGAVALFFLLKIVLSKIGGRYG